MKDAEEEVPDVVDQSIHVAGVGGPKDRHPLNWNAPSYKRMIICPLYYKK